MQRFFFDDENIIDDIFEVGGEKYNHIVRSLRMSVGEKILFCDGNYYDYDCEIIDINNECVKLKVINKYFNKTESKLKITVFQCLPKGDKMDDMVKRCVQFGAYEIIPVLSKRCVSRPDSKSMSKKIERLNKIARSSAMQSMRGYIPVVKPILDFKTAIQVMKEYSSAFICYEGENTNNILRSDMIGSNVAFLVGPEGGLDIDEVNIALNSGIKCVSLGRRILRTEDAAAFFIPIILSVSGNL